MKPFKDYEKVQSYTERVQLPTGGYVGTIMGAEEAEYGDYAKLLISVDVTEGEFAGYYAERYRADKDNPDRKWKGVLRLSVPSDDGSEQDSWTKRSFKTNIEAVEDSNDGYHWDWDESKLKGKTVGFLVRQKEWEYKDKRGWAPEIFKLVPVNLIRDGKFKMPEDKPLGGKAAASANTSGFTPVNASDDDLPF